MNLFWKRITKTATFEQEMADRHELYHSFVKTEKSALLEEYKELCEINFKQAKKEFKKKSDYMASPMYAKEERFKTLHQDSDIQNYLHFEKSNAFNFNEQFTQVSTEEFSGNKLDKKWVNAYRWSYSQIKGNYSNPGEFQAYTEGKNTEVIDGQLHIISKRKDAVGRTWDKEKGFISKPYKFTSDLIAGEPFSSDKGCILIKFKVQGAAKPLHHFIRAYDNKNQRCITLLESNSKRKFKVGRAQRNGKDNLYNTISGLNMEKDFHILELEWNKEVVIWRLNGHLLHQDTHVEDMKDLHLVIGSYLSGPKEAEGKIIVDYIRIFDQRKK